MKKVNLKYIGLGVLLVVGIPVIMDKFIIGNNRPSNIDNSDWVSFLGSYIGSIIGILGIFTVTKIEQKQREKEWKEQLFLNNIKIYKDISILMSTKNLSDLKHNLSEIKNRDSWNMLDIVTKSKLNMIETDLYYNDEFTGALNAIESFIRNNFYEEFTVLKSCYINDINDYIEYEDMENEAVRSLATIIINYIKIDEIYEDSIYINISKDKLAKLIKENKYCKGYEIHIDKVYKKIYEIGKSKDWEKYIRNRDILFKELIKLKTTIDLRIKKTLTY